MPLRVVLLALVLGLWSAPVAAQESHRFDAKALTRAFGLPVYAPRGRVLDAEVIELVNDTDHLHTAVYSVRADLKGALDFYAKAMGEPAHTGSQATGDEQYTFKTPADPRSAIRRRVVLKPRPGAHLVQVTLWQKEYLSPADAAGD